MRTIITALSILIFSESYGAVLPKFDDGYGLHCISKDSLVKDKYYEIDNRKVRIREFSFIKDKLGYWPIFHLSPLPSRLVWNEGTVTFILDRKTLQLDADTGEFKRQFDCKIVTIDEIREQANDLLNQMMEENKI